MLTGRPVKSLGWQGRRMSRPCILEASSGLSHVQLHQLGRTLLPINHRFLCVLARRHPAGMTAASIQYSELPGIPGCLRSFTQGVQPTHLPEDPHGGSPPTGHAVPPPSRRPPCSGGTLWTKLPSTPPGNLTPLGKPPCTWTMLPPWGRQLLARPARLSPPQLVGPEACLERLMAGQRPHKSFLLLHIVSSGGS